MIVFTVLGHVEVVTTTAVADRVRVAFGTAGFVVAFVGLVGLYPAIADRTPWMARTSVAFTLVPALGWFALTMWNIGVVVRILHPGDTNPLVGGVYILTAIVTVPAYVLFGLASLRADAHPRIVTLLLLAMPIVALFLFLLAGGLLFVFGSGVALAHLAIGFLLLARDGPTNRPEAPPDSTA